MNADTGLFFALILGIIIGDFLSGFVHARQLGEQLRDRINRGQGG